MSTMNSNVDFYFRKAKKWQEEVEQLRRIILDCQELTEELKWGVPCYTFEKSNVVLIHYFKEYCAILFVKGVLLDDPMKILIQQTENVQAGRQIRFTNILEILNLESIIKSYIKEAVGVEISGLKVEFKKHQECIIPVEFQRITQEMPTVEKAFYKLTPGRQKAYLLYFSSPKQSKTRESRIEKSIQNILRGIGLHD